MADERAVGPEAPPESGAVEESLREVFERHRATPGTPFDETRFLDFLLPEPRRKGDVRDSFAGQLRLHRFFDTVQLDCLVCFSVADLERAWSLSSLAERVRHKQTDPGASLRLVRERRRAERGADVTLRLVASLLALLAGAALGAAVDSNTAGATLGAVLLIALNAGVAIVQRRTLRYLARLEGALTARAGRAPGRARA